MSDDHAILVLHSRAAVMRCRMSREERACEIEAVRTVIAASRDLLRRIAEWGAAVAADPHLPHPPRPT
jgi:hypothetical protein